MSSLSQVVHKDMTMTESGIVSAFLELIINRECALGEGHRKMIWCAMTRLSPLPSVLFPPSQRVRLLPIP